jgi:hypothetical protein
MFKGLGLYMEEGGHRFGGCTEENSGHGVCSRRRGVIESGRAINRLDRSA